MTKIDRMDLRQIVDWFFKKGMPATARYFTDYRKDSYYTIDEWWIDKSFVTRHVGDEIMRRMECDCLTWIPS
jgi:hypothetical protein